MVMRPQTLSTGEMLANTSFLVPHFEGNGAKLLSIMFEEDIHTITYEEDWNYYTTFWFSEIWGDKIPPKLVIVEDILGFIQRRLVYNSFHCLIPSWRNRSRSSSEDRPRDYHPEGC